MTNKHFKKLRRLDRSLERALRNYEIKLDKGRVSLPAEMGKMVIVVSNRADLLSHVPANDQVEAFHNEADDLKDHYTRYYDTVEIRRRAIKSDISMDLSDKDTSGIVLIGHGNIGDFWLEKSDHLTWKDASNSRYLRMGEFVQRTCGNFPNNLTVPLGTFAVSEQSSYTAPVGEFIDDISPNEELFRLVYDRPVHSIEDIHRLVDQYTNPDLNPNYVEQYH